MWRSSCTGADSTAMSALAPPEPWVKARFSSVCLPVIAVSLGLLPGRLRTLKARLGCPDSGLSRLEEGPVAAAPQAQVVLHVTDPIDVGDVLDPPLVGL